MPTHANPLLSPTAAHDRASVARTMHPFFAMGIALRSRSEPLKFSMNGFCICAECRPAEEVAGDFYAITAREPGRLALVIGDACGRGREGAALLPEVLPKVRELLRAGLDPARLLSELNQVALRTLPIDRFITAAALEIDTELCTLCVANAGHVPALVRSAGSHIRVVGRASGPPLGVVANACYRDEVVPLGNRETVVLMTDGVLESIEADLCEMPRLRALLRHSGPGAFGVSQAILDALAHGPKRQPRDDVTLLCIELPALTQVRVRGAG